MAFCTKCGAQIGEGDTFCGKCGVKVGTVTSPTSNTQLEHEQMSQTTDTRHTDSSKLIIFGLEVLGLAMMVVGVVLAMVKRDYGYMTPYLSEDIVHPYRDWGIPIAAFGLIMFIVGAAMYFYRLKISKR